MVQQEQNDLRLLFRFIKYLAILNGDGELENNLKEIYYPEFELKKENKINTENFF